tara:strand:+ start:1067 stop:1894 length:828 start_codon:yes stop_codon:yes gene_type:complete
MKISIVLPTLGRKDEVDNLLSSLSEIKKYPHEILIVDQNFNSLIDGVILKHSNVFNIRHYKVDFRSLSKAKNFGISKVEGEVICFVDDDAEFFPDTISTALNSLKELEIDIVCGRCVDRNNVSSVITFDLKSSWLTKKYFEGKFIESTMFFKKKCFQDYTYDENLGIGSFHGAEEGYDLVYRMINDDLKIYYNSNIIFYHPQVISTHTSDREIRRVFTYRCGFAYVCTKHNLLKKYYSRLIVVLLYIPYSLLFRRKTTRYYIVELLGLIAGKFIR